MPKRVSKITRRQVFDDPSLPLSVRRIPRHFTSQEPHGHEFHELVVIVKGRGLHHVGEVTYEIRPGEVFVLLGDMTHNYPAAEDLYLINVLFDPERLGLNTWDLHALPGYHALFEIEPRLRRVGRFTNRLELEVDELAQSMGIIGEMEEELAARRPGYRYLAVSLMMRLIGHVSRCYSQRPNTFARESVQLGKVLSAIESRWEEPVLIEDLCRAGHLSRSSLMRKFRQVTGHSPIDYLIRFRVAQARKMLLETDRSITEIALSCGFSDSNYFARQFRRVLGISPRSYRRRCAEVGR